MRLFLMKRIRGESRKKHTHTTIKQVDKREEKDKTSNPSTTVNVPWPIVRF